MHALHGALGGVEQGDERIEPPSGLGATRCVGCLPPGLVEASSARRPGCVPHPPEQLVDGLPQCCGIGDVLQQRTESRGGARLRRVQQVEGRRFSQRQAQQLARRCRAAVLQLAMPESRAEPAEADAVETAEGRAQRLGESIRLPFGHGRHGEAHDAEDVAHDLLAAQRPLHAGGAGRHLSRRQFDIEVHHLPGVVREHRHPVPRDPLFEVPVAQYGRDAVDLLVGRRREEGRDAGVLRLLVPRRRCTPVLDPPGDADRLSHPPRQIGERGCLPVRLVEDEQIAENGGQPGEQLGARSAERTRGDVGIAEGEHRDPTIAQGLHDGDAAGGELLGVIDEHRPQLAERPERWRVGRAQQSSRLAEQIGRIAMRGAELVEHAPVLDDEVGDGAPGVAIRFPQLLRRHPELGAFGDERAQFRTEVLRGADHGAELRRPALDAVILVALVTGEEFGDDAVLIGSGEQRRRFIALLHHRTTHQLEGEGAERSRQRPGSRLVDAHADAIAQHRRGLPVRGEHQHLRRPQAAGEKVHDAIGEGAGLARAGRSDDHAGCGRRGADDGSLRSIRCHVLHASGVRGHHSSPVFPGLCAHGETGRGGRSALDSTAVELGAVPDENVVT